MRNLEIMFAMFLMSAGLTACNKDNAVVANNVPEAAIAANTSTIKFEKTQDSSPLEIQEVLFDTPVAKEFLTTGNNGYIGNSEAVARGKKLYQLYSCMLCHGPDGYGQTGPSLRGADYRYPKDATDKGMFETIWNGSPAGMGGKGKGVMNPANAEDGLTPDEVLKIIAWTRSDSKVAGN